MDNVSKKNFKIIESSLKDFRVKYDDLTDVVKGLQNTVAMQQQEILTLSQTVTVLRARLAGGGATSGY